MNFQGDSLTVSVSDNGIAELVLNCPGSVNKFDRSTLNELKQVLQQLASSQGIKALVVVSEKSAFIVGADITEFLQTFKLPKDELLVWIKNATDIFDALEDLPFPTVSAVNGYALGGGCEAILATDYRVADDTARIGLPEVKLGIMPGFGGTVRLSRLIGADNAMEWITTGRDNKAVDCLKVGAVDAVVSPEKLRESAHQLAQQAAEGVFDWQAKRQAKLDPLPLSSIEAGMSFNLAKAMVLQKAGKHYPAPIAAVNCIEKGAGLARSEAMLIENEIFCQLAHSPEAQAQVGIFLADQFIKGKAKKAGKQATQKIGKAAVLGAGIMGGGIAYQSASRGVPVVMKDIQQPALQAGLDEASRLLAKQVERGRIDNSKMAKTLNAIEPTLHYQNLADTNIVVEAVVENPKVKAAVLAETELQISDDAILCSNTSTISIDLLAQSLQKPERFCGMHFFNPVNRMPLVEIIRGKDTSDDTIANVVAYAAKLGKSPIVVNDCPGFFVNRVLFPYFAAFNQLLLDGADWQQVDKVMEKVFGWPMGPAMLLDVVGLDTAVHAQQVMAQGYPERMALPETNLMQVLVDAQRLGQKNGLGFYKHEKDKKGRLQKVPDEAAIELLAPHCQPQKAFSAEDIIDRLMIPMINETVLCLEASIIASAQEADMALIYGLGFPPFRGGIFRYIQQRGSSNIAASAAQLSDLGPLYHLSASFKDKAEQNAGYLAE